MKGTKPQSTVMSTSTQQQGTRVGIEEETCLEGAWGAKIFLPEEEGRMWTTYLQKRHCVLLVLWARIMSVTKQVKTKILWKNNLWSISSCNSRQDRQNPCGEACMSPWFHRSMVAWGKETLVTLAHSSSWQPGWKKPEHNSKQTSTEDVGLAHADLDIHPSESSGLCQFSHHMLKIYPKPGALSQKIFNLLKNSEKKERENWQNNKPIFYCMPSIFTPHLCMGCRGSTVRTLCQCVITTPPRLPAAEQVYAAHAPSSVKTRNLTA